MTYLLNTDKTWPKLASQLAGALDHPWVTSIVRKSAIDDTLAGLHPMLSLTRVKVRVVRIIDETATTKTFVLQPNSLWAGAKSGQFIRLQLELNGRLVERIYSLSSRGGSRRLAITVKRKEGGVVSEHLHRHVRVGDVFTISQAAGEFVLPPLNSEFPKKILLLSAGSGITPVMSMLHDLKASDYQGDVVFLHACRTQSELIFDHQLHAYQAALPGWCIKIHTTEARGRLSVDDLLDHVPDLAQRATWLCGPAPWMDEIHQVWQDRAYSGALSSERFGSTPRVSLAPGAPVEVSFSTTGKRFTTQGAEPLLVQAERAGLTPKHGCRIGICRSCQCTKKTGAVENLLTGEVSTTPNELIRLCISAARSDVALDL